MTKAYVQTLVGWFVLAVLLLLAAWLAIDQDALHDPGKGVKRPFSFARVQLLWWTVLIVGAWTAIYAQRHELWRLTGPCLALMGISLGTTASARIIENRDRAPGMVSAMADVSEGILRDVLSDGTGLSVPRLQCFMFNLAFGLTFLVRTFTEAKGAFPDFDSTTLALLGLSSSGYVFMKSGEATAAVEAKSAKVTSARAVSGSASNELNDTNEPVVSEH